MILLCPNVSLEVDEFAHSPHRIRNQFGQIYIQYNPEKETGRMLSIHENVQLFHQARHSSQSNVQTLFIRFNPDPYEGGNMPLSDHHDYLLRYIRWVTSESQTRSLFAYPLGVMYLFYDNFDPAVEIREVINAGSSTRENYEDEPEPIGDPDEDESDGESEDDNEE